MAQLGNANTPSSLADLPEELSLAIIEELDMASIFNLSHTSRKFHRLADPADPSKREKRLDFLFEAQNFSRRGTHQDDGFACFSCAKVLSRNNFPCSQTKSKGEPQSQQRQRCCFLCVARKPRSQESSRLFRYSFEEDPYPYGGDEKKAVCLACREGQSGGSCRRALYAESLGDANRPGRWKDHR